MNKLIKILFLFSFCFNVKAQEPSYQIILKEQLAGLEIYNLNQDNDLNLYITTDKGIYFYNSTDLIKLKDATEAHGTSFFNLTKNSNGELFCNNLNGQFFKLTKDEIKLIHTTPDSLISETEYFTFDDHDNLIITSKKMYKVRYPDFSDIEIIREKTFKYNSSFVKINEDIFTLDTCLIRFNRNEYQSYDTKLWFVKLKGKLDSNLILNDFKSAKLIKYNPYTNQEIYVNINENLLHLLPYKNGFLTNIDNNGVLYFDKNLNQKNKTASWFKEHFISCMYQSKNGNLFLGTFNNGILLVKKTTTENLYEFKNRNITNIASFKNQLYFTLQTGEVYKTNSKYESQKLIDFDKRITSLNFISGDSSLLIETSGLSFEINPFEDEIKKNFNKHHGNTPKDYCKMREK